MMYNKFIIAYVTLCISLLLQVLTGGSNIVLTTKHLVVNTQHSENNSKFRYFP